MRRWTVLILLLAPSAVFAADVPVTNSAELTQAIQAATAGDVIILSPGTYPIDSNLRCNGVGTEAEPITVRAESLGDATIEFNAVEGFVVEGPFWTFENLIIRGVCADDSSCEHAFHVGGPGDDVTIRNNRVENFNAHLKANGSGTPRVWPDRGLVESNEFYNEAPRQTANPVTPLDIVGGDDWVVRSNFIHDFAKGGGNGISYAAFMKGKSRRGLFERNLVVCELLHQGQTRLGLSFGGGGTGDQFCEGGSCTPEHIDGVMQNNIIANCSDVGVYVNEGQNLLIQYNILYNTTGIDMRFDATSGVLANNVVGGQIRDRDNATSTRVGNLETSTAMLEQLFADPAALDFSPGDVAMLRDVADSTYPVDDDFCGSPRTAPFDIGAIEYDGDVCDTSTPFHGGSTDTPVNDAGMNGPDMQMPSSDAGLQLPDASDPIDTGTNAPGSDVGSATGGSNGGTKSASETSGCGCASARSGGVLEGVLGLLTLLAVRRRRR